MNMIIISIFYFKRLLGDKINKCGAAIIYLKKLYGINFKEFWGTVYLSGKF